MKKLISSLILILSLCFTLTACGEEDKFWEKTLSQFEIILGTDQAPINKDIFYEENLTFTQNIEDAISSGDENFSVLNDYEKMLKLSFNTTLTYYKNFGIVTLKTTDSAVKQAHEDLKKQIVSLKNQIDTFKNSKSIFENALKNVNNITSSPNALQELKKFKRAYSSLILEVSKTNIKFLETYEQSYLQLATLEPDIKYCYSSSLARIIYSYNLYAFGEFDGEYNKDQTILNYIDELYAKLNTSTFVSTNFNSWKDVYDRFLTEITIFEEALNNLDLLSINNLYDLTNIEKVYYEKITKFLNNYVKVMYEETLTLLGE